MSNAPTSLQLIYREVDRIHGKLTSPHSVELDQTELDFARRITGEIATSKVATELTRVRDTILLMSRIERIETELAAE